MASSDFLGVVGDVINTSGGGGHSSSHHHHHSHHHHRHSSRSSHSKKHRTSSRSRSRVRSRSASRHRGSKSTAEGFFGFGDGDSEGEGEVEGFTRRSIARGGLFGLPFTRSGLFGRSRSSYFKRSPRPGFVHRAVKQLKRLLRDLTHYAKRHPWKVFFLIIVPLFGSLGALLARFGLRIPASIERMLGMASRAGKGDPFGAVNDVVRMAGNLGGCKTSRIERRR